MAVTESDQAEGEKVVAEDRQYLIHSWSVQSALNPIPVAGAEGRYFWDYDGQALPRLRLAARQPRARPPASEARRRDQGAGRAALHDRAGRRERQALGARAPRRRVRCRAT